ncbi:MAG: MaoC family dehydratase N-terminal domain-containing protein [Halieaceae bacterium]
MADALPDLQQYVGGDFGPFLAWDEVNAAMIRHWCEAMGDACPLYTDTAAAAAAGFEQLAAPPTMLMAWTMPGYGGQRPPGSASGDHALGVLAIIEAAGYPGVVAVNCEQEYFQYLQVGDRVYFRSSCEAISDEKTTALGVGFFVTELATFYNQRDEVVGTQRFRVFKYRPQPRQAST